MGNLTVELLHDGDSMKRSDVQADSNIEAPKVWGPVKMPSPDGYRRDIDGLRSIAVILVLAFHAFPALVPGGFIGVDIFFVISGYLITSIVVRDTFTYKRFYANRVRRIFPALVLVLACVFALGWILFDLEEMTRLSKSILASSLFVPNFQFWREVGYFDAASETKPLLHLWSLGVEEQFYVV
ncbi:acyltransferase [Mesorhizobium sp. NZP2077]|uniref:acyltransferase family protein n=1 Tax=Mesorhizobium sp. NZP2077 TaxID=2483404 RepID=UPI001551B1BB|nr:acyltransferase [Mesorhizobium sp. NZP2077]QKD16560.1 acyltransferase [Mesorhizobium sp. NZP2077]